MKEIRPQPGWNWNAWFWVDKEEFRGEWKIGQCRYRIEKAVGRGTDGKLFLMVWVNYDKYDHDRFRQTFYEIGHEEYVTFLDRAILQGEVEVTERRRLIDRAKAPFIPPLDVHEAVTVYRDGRYVLGQKDGRVYLIVDGKKLLLSCHPYEPCLYITDENGEMTAVHNAFDPFCVLEAFHGGTTVTSITGREYDAKDFCEMTSFAAGMGNISISCAEKVFGDGPKEKLPEKGKPSAAEEPPAEKEAPAVGAGREAPEDKFPEDPFYGILAAYPDCEVDYCIVKDVLPYSGFESHKRALGSAVRKLFASDGDLQDCRYDLSRATGEKIETDEFFSQEEWEGERSYRSAFLDPPCGNGYTEADFEKINAALFPNGTGDTEIFKWSTDWSDYFDDGHEWWGALCVTVYDKSLDRFAVILASATD